MNDSLRRQTLLKISILLALLFWIIPGSSAQVSPYAECRRFARGDGSNPDFQSFVLPLQFEKGVALDNMGKSPSKFAGKVPWFYRIQRNIGYHYSAVTGGWTIQFENPIAAFGSTAGAPPFFVGNSYSFAISAGCSHWINDSYEDINTPTRLIRISVYRKNDFVDSNSKVQPLEQRIISVPTLNWYGHTGTDLEVSEFTANGFQKTFEFYGLTTTLKPVDMTAGPVFGINSRTPYIITHRASSANYYYKIEMLGDVPLRSVTYSSGYPMVKPPGNVPWEENQDNWSPLYTINFDSHSPWQTTFSDRPQFQGQPMPPQYYGKSLAELRAVKPNISVSVPTEPDAYLSIDHSPELRQHPMLDRFVSDMGNDPLLLANYVLNEIDLTNPIGVPADGNVITYGISPPGVSRNAFGVFLEGQGSPMEQCALLVYLLRKAGTPAAYAFPTKDAITVLDSSVSNMLGMQIRGLEKQDGLPPEPQSIPVNYPWVVAYVGGHWINLFPWLKDRQIVEGYNLYDYIPSHYNSGFKWVWQYASADPAIMDLGDNTNSGAEFFRKFVRKSLEANPGISIDDLGVKTLLRKNYHPTWDSMPQPFSYSGTANIKESLRFNPELFDTIEVGITAGQNPDWIFMTPHLRICDVQNRRFLVRTVKTGPNQHNVILTLSPFRPGNAVNGDFSSDPELIGMQTLSGELPQSDSDPANDYIAVSIFTNNSAYLPQDYFPARYNDSPYGFDYTSTTLRYHFIHKGDLAAICLNVGRVSQKMLDLQVNEFYNIKSSIASNPSYLPDPEVIQGTLAYLLGLQYYKNTSDSNVSLANLHKVKICSEQSIGLAKLKARRENGLLPNNGDIDPVTPALDIGFHIISLFGNGTIHADSGDSWISGIENFSMVRIAEGSSEEHRTINQLFNQTDAVSTIRLLQLAKQRDGMDPVYLDQATLDSQADQEFNGVSLSRTDPDLWQGIYKAIHPYLYAEYAPFFYDGRYNAGMITPGAVSNNSGTYRGVGGLVVGPYGWAALIGANLNPSESGEPPANGGNGTPFGDNTFAPGNAINLNLPKNPDGTYSLFIGGDTVPTLSVSNPLNFFDYDQQLRNGLVTPDPTYTLSLDSVAKGLKLGTDSSFADAYKAQQEIGDNSESSFKNLLNFVSDPVSVTSGEFYIDSVDLRLNGPMPLDFSRNYGSKVVSSDHIGFGWKTNNIPYLTVSVDGNKIYAADDDGSVIAFVKQNETQWVPKAEDNPEMCNAKDGHLGGTSNAFNCKIELSIDGDQQFYILTKSDGSTLKFKIMTFAFPESSGLVRTRPYLVCKTDNRGNYFVFSYGTDASQTDFSQVRRIQASNGNFMGFYYDAYGRIIEGYTGDGRRVYYGYDSFGDLTSATLPDGSVTKYEYQHDFYTVNGISHPYSQHLLTRVVKPENNILENSYDSQRRVIEQRAVVQSGTSNPVRNATFDYHWTSQVGDPVAGYTTVTDAYGRTTRYDLWDGQITLITDPLHQTIQQEWYVSGDNSPGAYPRSIKRSVDKRGQVKQFTYDTNGNVLTCEITGDLTGSGTTQSVTVTNTYLDKNRISQTVNSSTGIQTNYYYDDSSFPFLLTRNEISKNGTVIGAIKSEFESVIVPPLESHGLLKRITRAPGTADEAITEWNNNAKGLITSRTGFTGTDDSNVLYVLNYNLRNELIENKDALGRKVNYAYDDMGRRIWTEIHDETGALVSWNYDYYDGNGNLTWSDGPRYNPEDYIWRKYDGASRKTEEVRWRSRSKADGSGVEAEFGDGLYASTIYRYDQFGNVTDVANPLRNIVHMDYDGIGQMRTRTAYKGDPQTGSAIASESFEYEPGGSVSVYTSPLGAITRKYYTSAGALKRQENPDNSVLEWRYDLSGRIVRQVLSNNSYWQTDYDDINRTVTRTLISASGTVLSTTCEKRDLRGNVIWTKNAEDFVFQTTFDGLDRPKTVTGPAADGNSGQQITTNFYDNCGQVLTVANNRGEKTITVFDVRKRPLSVKVSNASGQIVSQTSYSYSADGQSVTTTAGSGTGAISTNTYTSASGEPLLTKFADGTFTRSAYDANGNQVSYTDELRRTTSYTYDAVNRLETTTLPDGATTTYNYDPAGNLTQRIMPGNLVWSGTHDGIGRTTAEWLQEGNNITRQFGYTYYNTGPYIGLAQSVTDGRGITSTNSYDDFLRVATVDSTGPLPEQNVSTTYSYDKRNLLKQIAQTSVDNANGPPTQVQRDYDGYGKIINERVYSNGTIFSDLVQKWDAAGRRENLALGNLIAAQGNGAGNSIAFGHQANGLLDSVTAGGKTSIFSYGDNGLLASRQNDWRTVTVDQRDSRGRLIQVTQAAGGAQTLQEILSWQADSRLSQYTANRQGDGGWNESTGFSYNSRNQLTREGYSSSVSNNGALAYEFDFGTSGGLGVRTQALSNGQWSSKLDTPGNFGRAGQESTSTVSINWTANGTATGAASVELALDGIPVSGVGFDTANGNWIATLALSPGRHQLIATGHNADNTQASSATSNFTVSGTGVGLSGSNATVAPEYDAIGNLTTRTFSDGRVQTLKWDALGRLVSVSQRDQVNNGYDWKAVYDGLGRRLGTVYTPVSANIPDTLSAQTIHSWYDPQVEFQEVAVMVNGERTWKIHGPDLNGIYGALQGIGGLETTIHESDGATTAYFNDTFGNIVASCNGTSMSWNSTKTGGYGPLPGTNPEHLSGSVTFAQATVWRGKRMDETGFYYLGARYYEPQGGRFISPDPLGHAASMSLYDYCNGDPVNGLDPDGRCAKGFGTGVANGASGLWDTVTGLAGGAYTAVTNPQQAWTSAQNTWNDVSYTASGVMLGLRTDPSGMAQAAIDGFSTGANNLTTQFSSANGAGQFFGGVAFTAATIEVGGGLSKLGGASGVTEAGAGIRVAVGEDMSSASGSTVWRHVPDGHPALADAQAGVVKPFGVTTDAALDVRAIGHELGFTEGSGVTSWTADLRWALQRKAQMGGVILETTAPEGSVWLNEAGHGIESQVLVPGNITGKVLTR